MKTNLTSVWKAACNSSITRFQKRKTTKSELKNEAASSELLHYTSIADLISQLGNVQESFDFIVSDVGTPDRYFQETDYHRLGRYLSFCLSLLLFERLQSLGSAGKPHNLIMQRQRGNPSHNKAFKETNEITLLPRNRSVDQSVEEGVTDLIRLVEGFMMNIKDQDTKLKYATMIKIEELRDLNCIEPSLSTSKLAYSSPNKNSKILGDQAESIVKFFEQRKGSPSKHLLNSDIVNELFSKSKSKLDQGFPEPDSTSRKTIGPFQNTKIGGKTIINNSKGICLENYRIPNHDSRQMHLKETQEIRSTKERQPFSTKNNIEYPKSKEKTLHKTKVSSKREDVVTQGKSHQMTTITGKITRLNTLPAESKFLAAVSCEDKENVVPVAMHARISLKTKKNKLSWMLKKSEAPPLSAGRKIKTTECKEFLKPTDQSSKISRSPLLTRKAAPAHSFEMSEVHGDDHMDQNNKLVLKLFRKAKESERGSLQASERQRSIMYKPPGNQEEERHFNKSNHGKFTPRTISTTPIDHKGISSRSQDRSVGLENLQHTINHWRNPSSQPSRENSCSTFPGLPVSKIVSHASYPDRSDHQIIVGNNTESSKDVSKYESLCDSKTPITGFLPKNSKVNIDKIESKTLYQTRNIFSPHISSVTIGLKEDSQAVVPRPQETEFSKKKWNLSKEDCNIVKLNGYNIIFHKKYQNPFNYGYHTRNQTVQNKEEDKSFIRTLQSHKRASTLANTSTSVFSRENSQIEASLSKTRNQSSTSQQSKLANKLEPLLKEKLNFNRELSLQKDKEAILSTFLAETKINSIKIVSDKRNREEQKITIGSKLKVIFPQKKTETKSFQEENPFHTRK